MRGYDKIITRLCWMELFEINVLLIVCKWEHLIHAATKPLSPKKLAKLKDMVEKHGEQESTQAIHFPMGGGSSVIWCRPEMKLHNLVHEITHAAHYLLKDRGTPLSEDTEEVYAYTVEHLFKELTKNPPREKISTPTKKRRGKGGRV